MTKQAITQSQNRFQDSLASLFQEKEFPSGFDLIFLKSSSDVGVERNGGRNGARLAPQSLLSYFKKLNKKSSLRAQTFGEFEVASESEERADFAVAQEAEARRIHHILTQSPKAFICHIGGGHDHIYPLLKAVSHEASKIIVINVDAHADTRLDEEFHSGTPFRQFSESYRGDFRLYQIGLLEFANSSSTLSPLKKGQTKILWRHELIEAQKLSEFFKEIEALIDDGTMVIFSLDSDALNGHEVPGVSAVNGHGISRGELVQIWDAYAKLPLKHKKIMGIYELNPVYDTVSMNSMRVLGTFIYECLDQK